MNTSIFRGGIPTQPDIDIIRAKYPESDLTPGLKIPYFEIANLIKTPVKSARFRIVTTAWRNQVERNNHIIIGCERGFGFKILAENGKLDFSQDKYRSGVKLVKKSAKIASYIDASALNEDDRRRLDGLTRRNSAILTLARSKRHIELPSI